MKTNHRLPSVLCIVMCLLTGVFPYHAKAQLTKHFNSQVYAIFNNHELRQTLIMPFSDRGTVAAFGTYESFEVPLEESTVGNPGLYGSAAFATDPETGTVFFANKSGNKPGIWLMHADGSKASIPFNAPNTHGHCITKMAMSPDGYIYLISTFTGKQVYANQPEGIIFRFKPAVKASDIKVETVGMLNRSLGYRNNLTYSGDMAFAANGDLYIFASAMDSTLSVYHNAGVFRIASKYCRQSNRQTVPVEYLGRIDGLGAELESDSAVITGVAFEQDGSFLLSTVDRFSGTRMQYYRGSINTKSIHVRPVFSALPVPPGFLPGDLSSGVLPSIHTAQWVMIKPVKGRELPRKAESGWENSVSLTTSGR